MAVGVSGGADSVALLRLLLNIRDSLGIVLVVAHFYHALRGAESDADAQFVEALAREHRLEFIGERAEVAAFAKEHRLNLEDAARRVRYAFFGRIAAEGRATRVAVAHTSDDQAETVLARLLRGTGPSGLASIYPVMRCVVRPLLECRREELREYLRALGQNWREDRSNQDLERQRAKIRMQLLPLLERNFTPAIVERLGELARLSWEEQEFWQALVESRFSSLVKEANGRFAISIRDLLEPLALPGSSSNRATDSLRSLTERPLTERLIRRLYKSVRGNVHDLTAKHVEQVLQLAIAGRSSQQAELPRGVVVERRFGELLFSLRAVPGTRMHFRETKVAPDAYHYRVELPERGIATICISELGTRLLVKVIDWPCGERDTKRDNALDADLLPTTLTVRNWQPGDAYRPRGHRQTRKLKQMLLSKRVDLAKRRLWPVLEYAGRIIWVRGMPPAAEFCAGERTRVGVLIEETEESRFPE